MSRILELKTGESRIFVEVDDAPGDSRLQKVAAAKDLKEDFAKVAMALKDVAASIEAQLGQLDRRPDEVTLEMGAKLTGSADLWIVKGDAEANIAITLKWSAPPAKS
jgi:hypothetical protein